MEARAELFAPGTLCMRLASVIVPRARLGMQPGMAVLINCLSPDCQIGSRGKTSDFEAKYSADSLTSSKNSVS